MPDQESVAHWPAFALPDVNVLVALTNPAHQHHLASHRWLAGTDRFATTPITENGLVRLLLNPAVTGQQVLGPHAVAILSGLRSQKGAVFLADDSSLATATIDLIGLAGHKQTTDLHLVNLAATNGGVLATLDRRLPGTLVKQDRRHVQLIE